MSSFAIARLVTSMDSLVLDGGRYFSPPTSNLVTASATPHLELVSSFEALRLQDEPLTNAHTSPTAGHGQRLPSLSDVLSSTFTDSLPPIMHDLHRRRECDRPRLPFTPLSVQDRSSPYRSVERPSRSRRHHRTPYSVPSGTKTHAPSQRATEDARVLAKLNGALHSALFTSSLRELDFDRELSRRPRRRRVQRCAFEANENALYLQGPQSIV